MKKFYATLAAVAFGCAALVAGPHYNKASEFVKGEMNSMQISELMTNKSVKMDSKVLQRKLQTLAAASRADEFPDVNGNYMVMYEKDTEGTAAVGTATLIQNDDVVTFHKFIFSDFFDFDGQMNWYTEEYDGQTYQYCLITIPGFAQTTVFNMDGQDLGLFLCGVENGKFGVYTDDIDLIVLEDPTIGGLYITTFYEDCGILFGYLTGESNLSYYTPLFLYPEMLPMNCETTSYWYDLEDLEAEPEEGIDPGFAFLADMDEDEVIDALIIYGFCGLPEPAVFAIDESNQKVIDAGSPLWEYQGIPFYLYPLTEDGGDIDLEGFVSGDYTVDGDMTMIDIDQVFALYAEDAGLAALIGPAFVAINFAIGDGGEEPQGDVLFSGEQELSWWDPCVKIMPEDFPLLTEGRTINVTFSAVDPEQEDPCFKMQTLNSDWSQTWLPGLAYVEGSEVAEPSEDNPAGDVHVPVTEPTTVSMTITAADVEAINAAGVQCIMIVGQGLTVSEVTVTGNGGSGINSVIAAPVQDTRIFNVMGVQVDENYKGIVISNGKKYIQR